MAINTKRTSVFDEKFDYKVDPDSIQGLSPEAVRVLKSGKDVKLFNQRGKKNFINKVELPDINYKNIDLILGFLNLIGGIVPRRITKADRKHQRMLKIAIKNARQLALIPYSNQKESAEFFE